MAKVAAYITYNDIETIQESVESIENKVDRIIAVDGKFKDFEGKQEISTDGTLSYLYGKDNIEVHICTGLYEVSKRNYFLNFVNVDDLVIIIDADEIFEGEIPDLDTDIGLIDIFEFNDRRRHRRYNRFFRYRDGVHIIGKHYLMVDKEGSLFTSLEHTSDKYTCKKIEGFHLIHKGKLRSIQRDLEKKKYYKILQQREAKINEIGHSFCNNQ